MTITEMENVMEEARMTLKRADAQSTKMGRMLMGRLRKVRDINALCTLKKELSKFNMTTFRWKD